MSATGKLSPEEWFERKTDMANNAVKGCIPFNHLGATLTTVGRSNIDWAGKHHNHQEWQAQLNRFFILPVLAAEYKETGEEMYAETARDFLSDWLKVHPPIDNWQTASYDNTLNLAVRTQMWVTTLAVFLDSPAFTDELVDLMITSITAQYRFLMNHFSIHGNWRIAQAHSMLYSSILLEGHVPATVWRKRAAHILNDAFFRQVLPDGCHEERNPGYHSWMNRVFDSLWRLSRSRPDLGLRMDAGKIARMHDYSLAVLAPNGGTNGMHDCGIPVNKKRTPDFGKARKAFYAEAGFPDAMPPLSHWFPDAGQALLRDSWDEDATYVTFDATVWGGGHCHLSRNSVQFMPFGKPLLIDPGSLTYEKSDPKSTHGKSTRAHNTINLNGMNQISANPDSRFASAPGYDFVESLYDAGYWPGEYLWHFNDGHGQGVFGEHHRAMLWARSKAVFIIDHLYHTGTDSKPDLESNWQFANVPVKLDAENSRAVTENQDVNMILLFAQHPTEALFTMHRGEDNPPRGWLPGQGEYVAAPQICLNLPKRDNWVTHLATVLIPFKGPEAPGVRIAESISPDEKGYGLIRLEWDNGDQDELWWKPKINSALDDVGPFVTDGAMVYLHRPAGKAPCHGLAVDASFIEPYAPKPRPHPEMLVFSEK